MTVTEGHILAAVMQEFEMSALDDTPCSSLSPEESFALDPLKRHDITIQALQKVVKKFVDVSVPSTTDGGKPQNLQRKKGVTGRSNRKKGKKAGADEADTVLEYARDVLSLGLLYMGFVDAIREGDGSRILLCWRYLLFVFRASHHTNYARGIYFAGSGEIHSQSTNGTSAKVE